MSVWEFFFKYPPLVFEKGRLVFATLLPGWMLLIAAALALLAGWAYLRRGGGVPARERVMLLGLRAAILGVLLFALFRPSLQVPVAVPQENYVGVLIDDSRSMQIADDAGETRGAQLQQRLDAELIGALQERFRVRLFRFSGAAERIAGVEELAFAGGQTRLGRALEQARGELAGLPLAGLVVVTDGGDRAESELNASLLGLRSASIPVFTVGVGREAFRRDVEVRRVSTPRTTLRGTALVVDAVIAQNGYAGRTVPLVVEDEGASSARRRSRCRPTGRRRRFASTSPPPSRGGAASASASRCRRGSRCGRTTTRTRWSRCATGRRRSSTSRASRAGR
jgi:hypothetical protein